jgi:hypothetical protein
MKDGIKAVPSYKIGDTYEGVLNNRYVTFEGHLYFSFTADRYITDYNYSKALTTRAFPFTVFSRRVPKKATAEEYTICVLAQLLFNNSETIKSWEELSRLFLVWVPNWIGNESVFTGKDISSIVYDGIVYLSKMKEDYVYAIYDSEYTSHWYPVEIELIQDGKERSIRKRELSSKFVASIIEHDAKETSLDFQANHFGVLPNLPHLEAKTAFSGYHISRYGKDYFTTTGKMKKGLIAAYSKAFPELSQLEISKHLNISERTIRRYLTSK